MVSKTQNAFAEGLQILVVLVSNEAIYSILRTNKCAIFCKLDIPKTCDHVNWSFLYVGKYGLWGEVSRVDRVVYLYCKFFYVDHWRPY